jgi:hypothetical protein
MAAPGPSNFSMGFADPRFESSISSARQGALAHAKRLGSTIIRLDVAWGDVAPAHPQASFDATNPADPQYNWSQLDAEVKDATAAGQTILLSIQNPAPPWAEPSLPRGARAGTWEPNATALGEFAHAVAARYSGAYPDPASRGSMLPRVSSYQVWNEANLPDYLEPQWARTSRGSIVPLSPDLYRQMLNAVYTNVKSVQPRAQVILGGLAPYGNGPGGARMTPVTFMRELLCLTGSQLRPKACANPAHFDGFDHHPYGATPTEHARNALDVALPDLGRLQHIVAVAQRTGRALPAGPKTMWVTEAAFDSSPPDRGANSLPRQAQYVSLGLYELWRQGVRYVTWFGLFDNPMATPGFTGTGVYFSNGRAKPSAAAFAFPFVALASGRGTVTIWGLSRAPGTVTIQRQSGRAWRTVARLRTTSGGVFYAQRRLGSHLVLRAVSGSRVSPPWATG